MAELSNLKHCAPSKQGHHGLPTCVKSTFGSEAPSAWILWSQRQPSKKRPYLERCQHKTFAVVLQRVDGISFSPLRLCLGDFSSFSFLPRRSAHRVVCTIWFSRKIFTVRRLSCPLCTLSQNRHRLRWSSDYKSWKTTASATKGVRSAPATSSQTSQQR